MNRTIATTLVAAAVLMFAQRAEAQVAITGAEIHIGDGTKIAKGTVVVGADGKIAAVGASVAAPSGAKVVDGSGKVLTPGLIDVGTSIGLMEIWAVAHARDGDAGPLDSPTDPNRSAFRASDAFNPMNIALPVARAGGVTGIVSHPWGGLIAGQPVYAELGGAQLGHARIVNDAAGMTVALGRRGASAAGGSRGSAMLMFREALEDARFWRANRGAFDQGRSRDLNQSRLDAQALNAAVDATKRFYISVDRASDILAVLALAADNNLQIALVGAAEGWLVARQIAAAKVPVVIQPMANLPSSFDALGMRADNAALLVDAGVTVAISTFDSHGAGRLRYMAGNAVRAGMEHSEALAAITSAPAAIAGVDGDVGTIAVGKRANLALWAGDPLEIATALDGLWVAGQQVSTRSRMDDLFDRYRTLPRRGQVEPRVVASDDAAETPDDDEDDGDVEPVD